MRSGVYVASEFCTTGRAYDSKPSNWESAQAYLGKPCGSYVCFRTHIVSLDKGTL